MLVKISFKAIKKQVHGFAQVFAYLKSWEKPVLDYAERHCATAQKTTLLTGRRTTAIFGVKSDFFYPKAPEKSITGNF